MSRTIQVNKNKAYQSLEQSDPEFNKDKFIIEQEIARKKKEKVSKTNIYKSRIIGKDKFINLNIINRH
jgi:hypothetical protein